MVNNRGTDTFPNPAAIFANTSNVYAVYATGDINGTGGLWE